MGKPAPWLAALRHTLADTRTGLLGWTLGLSLYALMNLAFYPVVRGDDSLNELMRTLPESLRVLFGEDLTSPAGYLTGQVLSLLPLMLSVYAGQLGARLVAGAERRGLLEFPLAHRVSRAELLLGRAAVLLGSLLTAGLGLFLTVWLLGPAFDLTVDPARLLSALLRHTLGAWVFGALALAVGAATGRPGLAVAAGAGLGVAALALHGLSAQVPALREVAGLNPWHYALGEAPLTRDLPWGPVLALALVGVAFVLAALPAFRRRDLAG